MKQSQMWKLLQNKMVLAAMLMVLVAGTAAAGVMALRNRESGEQDEEMDPGYAFQTEEGLQMQNQQLQMPEDEAGEGLQALEDTGVLQRSDREEADTKQDDALAADRPVQSGDVDAVSDQDEGRIDAEITDHVEADALAPGETLVAADDALVYEPETEAVLAPVDTLTFAADSTIGWPVFGNVILDYSMDTTIYFSTLEQYKCNPGILIQAEVGQPVEAAGRGLVTAIGVDEELGNFIMMDLGGDYSIVYGQLEDLTVSIGQVVEAGEVLGVVAQPTKYYVVEGPNVYLEMRWHQQPVDPLDFIR